MDPLQQSLVFGAIALLASALLTPAVRSSARRFGAVAVPRADRWHAKPTAMLGGVAIFLASMLPLLAARHQRRQDWVVLATSAAMFFFGLIDDRFEFKPYQKLIAQLAMAGVVVYFGLVLPWTGSEVVNIAITFVWLVGITNAVNLLDNMDGLAAGISAFAAIFLAINFYQNHQMAETLALSIFAGALLGFLIYNHNPASIFMGDCGSMFIGWFLASTALLSGTGGGRSRSVVAVLAVPVLVLFVPIFDTTFVAVMRKLAGRNPMKGGRDHTSHRLVALGLSEKRAVWLLWSLALGSGLLGLLVRHVALDVSIAAIAGFVVVLTLLGVHLAHVRVYAEEEIAAAREKPLVSFLIDLSYKRRLFEVLLDSILISLAYYMAYALKFGGITDSPDRDLFVRSLPVIVCLKLATFLFMGVYRGIWRYTTVTDVFRFTRIVAVASMVSVLAIVFIFKFSGFSRAVFLLDGILLLTMITSTRFAFRLFRRVLPAQRGEGTRRVLIYGAGDGGELALREMNNNRSLNIVPIGFIDDDPAKVGRMIHGLRVYSTRYSVSALCRQLHADELVISTMKIATDRLARIVGECATSDIPVSRANMSFQRLSASDFGWVGASASELPATPAPLISPLGDANLMHPPGTTIATEH